ncbi:MAG: spermidine/putrescine ABC transporter, partial [Firmicutes bacterium]|nr:spermidine/putrescine ABC transporter [Bacillota bacterium]
MVKKIAGFILVLVMAAPTFVGCSFFGGTTVLKVMNWADYFDETLLKDFEDYYFDETGNKVSVLYETIDKPESMAVKIEKGKETWDL